MEQNHSYEAALILTTMFNLGSQTLFTFTTLLFMFGIPYMREQALNFLYGKPIPLRVQKITPVQEEKDVYFNHLRSMWEIPR
jgi:hypothetical protein